MEAQGYLSASAANAARTDPATISPAAAARAGGYFADWVMQSGPEFFTRNTTEDVIIRTTLDPRIQKSAEDALTYIFENKVREGSKAQAAIVVMSADGAVRGMVGGRNSKVSGAFNRATQANRQTGSAFKPFVYATALDLGAGPNDPVVDAPLCLNVRGSGEWCPKNYTKEFKGEVDLTAAGPALALGASESTLLEMTGAYAGILNGGSSVTPYGLVELRLQGDDEPLMGAGGGIGERVITPKAAQHLVYMMNQVVEAGTGGRANLGDRQSAGKTGTTQAARDAWFIGFTADYVAGVWMGYDDNTPLRGVTGGGLPADIWRETMVRVHDGRPVTPLPMLKPAPKPKPKPAPKPVAQNQQQSQGNQGSQGSQGKQRDNAERLLFRILGDILQGN